MHWGVEKSHLIDYSKEVSNNIAYRIFIGDPYIYRMSLLIPQSKDTLNIKRVDVLIGHVLIFLNVDLS